MKENGPNTMINLDKCDSQAKFVAAYILLREYGMLGNVFIKSSQSAATMASWYAAAAQAWNAKYPDGTQLTADDVCDSVLYVYVLGTVSTSAIAAHLADNGNLVMVEICIGDDAEDAGMLELVEPWCKENNVAMFVNTMWSGLCSTKADTETTWAEMIDRGYTAIQTDQPSELTEYLQAYNNGHASTGTIEAEHFHMFNYDSYGLNVAEEADSSLNKKVTGMHDGDWLRYEKITFQGGENVLTLNMRAGSNEGTLSVYLDDEVEPVAELALSESTVYSNITIVLNDEIEAGTHAITLAVNGLPGAGLLSVDNFTFGTAEISGSKNLEKVEVSTEVGVAPVLPNTVNAVADGLSYAMNVSWEAVSPSSYAQEGTFKVLGYVNALEAYVEATVTVYSIDPAIAEENLVAWFDASEGVTSSGGAVTEWTAKAGGLTATVSSGSPVVDNAIGGEKGIYFDGNDALTFTLADADFWNETDAQYTVLMYVSSNSVTSGNGTTTSGASVDKGNQRTSVLWFKEAGDWGGAYFEASQNEIIWRYGSGVSQDRGTTYVREAPIGELYSATAIRKNGSTDTVFVDGESIYTYTAKSANTSRIGNVGQIGQGVNSYFKGTICQILIYDTALTDSEIIAAQRWMAEKYADKVESVQTVTVQTTATNAPVMPESVTVTYESGAEVELGVKWENIKPSNYQTLGSFPVKGTLSNGDSITATVEVVGGANFKDVKDSLLLWMSAQSLSGEDSISEWTAKNNSAIKFVQATAGAQPTVVTDGEGNIVGVKFDGTDDLMTLDATGLTEETSPLKDLNGQSGLTVVVYSKPEGTAAGAINYNHFSSVIYMGETDGWGGLYLGTFTNGVGGRIGTGTSQYRGILYNTGSYNDYFTTVLRKNGTSLDELIIDNETISSVIYQGATSGSATQRINTTTDVKLGQGKIDGSIPTMWQGTVSEIMIFNKSLSDAELGGVYAYLTETYGATYAETDTSFVTDIYLEQAGATVELAVGQQVQLNASVIPATAINQSLTYVSGNTKVATVDENGKVTAVGAGYAAITVTTADGGYSASCVVKVAATSEDSMWTSIVNLRQWAAAQDESDYEDFSGMEAALEQTADITKDSDAQALEDAYNTLRDAMMALVSLAEARENAQAELTAYRTAFNDSDYREAQIAELDGIVSDGNAAIHAAGDFETISTALADAKDKLDAVKTDEEMDAEEEAAAIAAAAAAANASAQQAAASAEAAAAAYDAALAAVEAAEAAEASDFSAVENACAAAEAAKEQMEAAEEAADAAAIAAEEAAAADDSVSAEEAAVAAAEAAELAKNAAAAAEAAAETAKAWQAAQEKLAAAEEKAAAAEKEAADAKEEAADAKEEAADAKEEAADAKEEAANAKEEAAAAKEEAAAAAEAAALADAKLQALQELNAKAAELMAAATTTEQIENIAAAQSAAAARIADASSVDELPEVIEAALAAMEASACPSEKFADVAADGWYHEAVDFMVLRGYMNGYSDTKFGVAGKLTRAELVTILYRVEQPDVSGMSNPFTDLTGEWYVDAVSWAYNAGVVEGVCETAFDPNTPISRQQVVTILYRYEGAAPVDEDHLAGYTDAGRVADYAADAMNWAVGNGIIKGTSETILAPDATATRAEIATILMRYLAG